MEVNSKSESGTNELYNLNKDSKEKKNIFLEETEQTKLLKQKLQTFLKRAFK